MTTYDAWSAFEPNVAQAIRNALRTGDWSAFHPEVAAAFNQVLTTGDWSAFDPQVAQAIYAGIEQDRQAEDPWSAFDPEAAKVLKGIFEQQFDKAFKPVNEGMRRVQMEAEDRAFAAEETRLKAIFGDAYTKNRRAILQFAVDNKISNAENALHAWRGSQGQGPAVAQPAAAGGPTNPTEDRIREIRAELADLGFHGTDAKRSALKYELQDLENEQALSILKAANDPDGWRRDRIHEANDASARHNAARTSRISKGYVDKGDRMSKDEKRARMDLDALDIVQGRKQAPKAQRKSSDRAAEDAGLDARDREALALVHAANGDPDVSTPNAEAAFQEITTESGN